MTEIPQRMNAVTITGAGGPDVLGVEAIETPTPGTGQVLIKVAAAGINRPDVMQRSGTYPAPKGHCQTPGLEVSGTVVAMGDGTKRFKVGDRVIALVNGGGYAEYCVAEQGSCLPVPAGLSMTDAAGIPETFFTVWHNVFERGGLQSREWFLIHGGTSGIGVTAIQLAKAFGANVIATAGSKRKCEACTELGADHVINYQEDDFVEQIKSITAKRGVNVILDMVGGDYIGRNIKCLADDGRLVNIAYQHGSKAEIDFLRIMLKRLTITGSTLRIRTNDVKAGIAAALEDKVLPLFGQGKLSVVVDSAFPLSEVQAAHKRMDAGQHIGKIILDVS